MSYGNLNVCTNFPLFTFIFIVIFVNVASPGANDLHFYDGASTIDVIAGDVFFEIIDPPELRYSYRIRPAKDFGATFNESIHFENARLVPTVPINSCGDIINLEELFGHIALSERGECSFVHKTAKAQQAGARAIIITESIDKWEDSLDYLVEMIDDKHKVIILISHGDVVLDDPNNKARMDLDVNIPAAFLIGRSGATIFKTLRRLHKKYAIINLPINMTYTPITKMNQPPWISW